jgi:hypothetical protein
MCRPMSEPAPAKPAGLHVARAVAPYKFFRHNGGASWCGPFHRRFIAEATDCCADQISFHGSRAWKLRYSLAVCTVHWAPLLSPDSCPHDTAVNPGCNEDEARPFRGRAHSGWQ